MALEEEERKRKFRVGTLAAYGAVHDLSATDFSCKDSNIRHGYIAKTIAQQVVSQQYS